MTITPKRIRELLFYDGRLGLFKWKNPTAHQASDWFKGNKSVRKYRRLYIDGHHYMAHVIAWVIIKGEFPKIGIDHEDRNQENNRWKNLREATQLQNSKNRSIARNNKTGVTGVSIFNDRFRASIRIDTKRIHLGLFDTVKEAAKVRRKAEKEYFGEFAGQ